MGELNSNLYRGEEVRELDRLAIEDSGIPGNVLMERAGAAAFECLRRHWPEARSLAVLCGTGNNGGDGFVLARLAREADLPVTVFQVGDEARLRGDALAAQQRLAGAGVTPEPFTGHKLAGYDVLVDGLLGTGLHGEVSDHWREAIEAMNHSGRPVLALDIPSGLDADTGTAPGAAVRAAVTITFIGIKRGLVMETGRELCGELVFDTLSVPDSVYRKGPKPATALRYDELAALLKPRHRAGHKGHYGHVLIVGGETGYTGAVRLAGEAAARAGAGLVSVATRRAHAAVTNMGRPELMCHGVETAAELAPLLRRASVVAIGPGLGQGDWGAAMLAAILDTRLPTIFDADALNLLAHEPERGRNRILTPHPGEAARLLGCTADDIQQDRFFAAEQLQQRYGGVVILKGAGTLVRSAQGTGLCMGGNPGMASGGMGDVLSGILGALVAQGFPPLVAAKLGVCLHAEAGDQAAQAAGERGLVASDLMPWIRRLANPAPAAVATPAGGVPR